MTETQTFDVKLPVKLAQEVEDKIRAGEFASVQDAVVEGLRALLGRDSEIERWLRDEVVPGHAQYLADPTRTVSADDVLHRIKARRARS